MFYRFSPAEALANSSGRVDYVRENFPPFMKSGRQIANCQSKLIIVLDAMCCSYDGKPILLNGGIATARRRSFAAPADQRRTLATSIKFLELCTPGHGKSCGTSGHGQNAVVGRNGPAAKRKNLVSRVKVCVDATCENRSRPPGLLAMF